MNEQMKKEINSLVENAKNVYISSVDENGYPNTKAMFSLQRDGFGRPSFFSQSIFKKSGTIQTEP